ncbi:MAG: peptidoglycan -binding protein [Albidovulum sp.]
MANPGRGGRGVSATIWPGFVDLMTALVMVLMFLLTIFMVLQFALRDTINTQDDELSALNNQLAGLADSLGLERENNAALEAQISVLSGDLASAKAEGDAQAARIAGLISDLAGRDARLAEAGEEITAFESQVAALLSDADRARTQISAQEAAAKLAEAKRAALEALAADLRREAADKDAELAQAQSALQGEISSRTALTDQLSAAEKARLEEAALAAALRQKLQGAEDELTAMTLALDAQRQKAEETLTLLAAAEAAKNQLADTNTDSLSEAAQKQALLALAQQELSQEKTISADAARKVTLLNEQVATLRRQLGALQDILDASAAKDADAKVQIEALGSQLNSALARVAAEESRRAALEEAERIRLEQEAKALTAEAELLKDETRQLALYRSEFFGKLSQVLAGREGVRVVGDRFVFSSEVLFQPGSADLLAEGKAQIAGVVATLQEVAVVIPPEIDWIIRVDGHTDNLPLSGFGPIKDNWELSQARALSVVRYMQNELGFPPQRLAATGFGEYRPVETGDTPEARAQNRRIELKLTER